MITPFRVGGYATIPLGMEDSVSSLRHEVTNRHVPLPAPCGSCALLPSFWSSSLRVHAVMSNGLRCSVTTGSEICHHRTQAHYLEDLPCAPFSRLSHPPAIK